MGEIQKPNKSAEQIGKVGRIRPPILGGGGGLPITFCVEGWSMVKVQLGLGRRPVMVCMTMAAAWLS